MPIFYYWDDVADKTSESPSRAVPIAMSDDARTRLITELHSTVCEDPLVDHLDPDWPGLCAQGVDALLPLIGAERQAASNETDDFDAEDTDGYCTCDGNDLWLNASCGIRAHRDAARNVIRNREVAAAIDGEDTDQCLSIAQAAEIVGVTRTAIYRAMDDGRIDITMQDGWRRIRPSALERYVSRRRRRPMS